MLTNIDTSVLDKIITGRVTPTIYAFQTNTYPNYLKIGDTYRPVSIRLNEWRRHYENLELLCTRPAVLDSGNYFRDYSIHEFLVRVKRLERLKENESKGKYYSREFFKGAKESDIDEAINDIKLSEEMSDGRYLLYSEDRRPVVIDYVRDTEPIKLRDIQEKTVDNFVKAVANNQDNLLMYAVMRFGKSITAMSCAVAMKAKLVLVLCGKTDVEDEWRHTVKKIANFDGFEFFTSKDLSAGVSIAEEINLGNKVVVFLSLQDLQGTTIKQKHKELLDHTIDLLIIDETHFGARAEKYGKILKDSQLKKKEIEQETKDLETESEEDLTKVLNYKVQLHLSGTPYRILMSNNEFKPQDIIAFYQFTDIIQAQKKWDEENLGLDTVQEWDNPYYGFPQMVRFAFNPNKATRKLLESLKSKGVTYAFAELFRPQSIIKDKAGLYKKFKHESEIIDLFELIDGGTGKSEDGILSFLNYRPIQEGQMCRHIVIVLPFKASCDALEELFIRNNSRLPLISQYEIVNIAGLDSHIRFPETSDIKKHIRELELTGRKTITLTVNRMLTGTTVEQWDTMIYLKDTLSPQEYDQAIFRIQNQYIKQFVDEKGTVIKYNMKPQTILVDFDPARMMRLQELKSKFYNVNTVANGNDLLEDRIRYELEISPIITINKNKIVQVEAKDVMDVVRNYSHSKSIIDEALGIAFDNTLLIDPDILEAVRKMSEIGDSKGLNFIPNEEPENNDEDDIDLETDDQISSTTEKKVSDKSGNNDTQNENLEKKLKAYYSLILFFSFLTTSRVKGLRDIIKVISSNPEDQRIANNIGLRVKILKLLLIKGDAFIRSDLEYAIDHINSLILDDSLTPLERVSIAINKFSRISDSEVVTPQKVATEIIEMLPAKKVNKDSVFLDIASIQGEMAISIISKWGNLIDNNKIYSLPTSRLSYELTRKVYSVLGLPIENVLYDVFSSDFIDKSSAQYQKIESLKPNFIVGGPPFNSNDGGGRGDSASALYHNYVNRAIEIGPDCISMFMKSVWYSGGKGTGLKEFRDSFINDRHISILSDYPDAEYLEFQSTLRGGVCMFLWEKDYNGKTKVISHINNYVSTQFRYLKHKDTNILIRYNNEALTILDKVRDMSDSFMGDVVTSRNPFKISGKIVKKERKSKNFSLKIYDVKKKIYYISPLLVNLDSAGFKSWKVLVAKSSPGTDKFPHKVISDPVIAEPMSACTEGLVIVSMCENKEQAINLARYMKTKFFRFMMILAKNSHNLTKDVYRFVPVMDYNQNWTDNELYQHFGIDSEEQAFIDRVVKKWE